MDLKEWSDMYKHIKRQPCDAVPGDNIIITGISTSVVVVTQIMLFFTKETDVFFKDGLTGPQLTGTIHVPKSGYPMILPFVGGGWFEGSVNESIVLNLSKGNAGGVIGYLYQSV